MFRHRQVRELQFPPAMIFDLVIDVEAYPQFLPWCKAARIKHAGKQTIIAELIVGTRGISECFTSRIDHDRMAGIITTTGIDGPFSSLHNRWQIEPGQPSEPGQQALESGSRIEFEVAFAFRSRLLGGLFRPFFEHAITRMVESFERRAIDLHNNH